jgi:seryl-tRNA synthetase
MLDLRYVIENLDEVRQRTANRNTAFDFGRLDALATERRTAIGEFEAVRAEQKRRSDAMKSLKPGSDEFNATRAELKGLSDRGTQLEERKKAVEAELEMLLLYLPNRHSDFTPIGADETGNVMARSWGAPRTFDFEVRDHVTLGEKLGILDMEAAGRVSGARFAFMRGAGARLERALAQFMLDLHTREHGYEEMLPPYMVNADAMTGTGQLPKFEQDLFKTGSYYLIPTAEVPVTNYHREQILPSLDRPLKYCAWTPCFRAEAGSHGRDVRGLIRQHQFHKVELVKFCRPETSYAELDALVLDASRVLELLGLPYRVMELCSGDMSAGAARCFDIEVWLPSQNTYREISSCSNFEAYQARRAGIRFRDENGKPQFAHTLNGSALAVGRTWVAVMENYQEADGSVTVPPVLRSYMGCDRITLA